MCVARDLVTQRYTLRAASGEEVLQKDVERDELKVGTQQGLVMTSMRAYQEEAVGAKDEDVVFVDTAGISQWNRVISQLLPSISVIGIADTIGTN